MLKINEKFEIREDDELNYGLYELKEGQTDARKAEGVAAHRVFRESLPRPYGGVEQVHQRNDWARSIRLPIALGAVGKD